MNLKGLRVFSEKYSCQRIQVPSIMDVSLVWGAEGQGLWEVIGREAFPPSMRSGIIGKGLVGGVFIVSPHLPSTPQDAALTRCWGLVLGA